MLTIAEMQKLKKQYGYSYAKLAELTGLPFGTLQKAMNGSTASPRYDTMCALNRFFEGLREGNGQSGQGWSGQAPGERPGQGQPQEQPQPQERSNGSWVMSEKTQYFREPGIEAYDREKAAEAGRPGEASPILIHQDLQFLIHKAFYDYIRSQKLQYHTYSGPVDVQLAPDAPTMVHPDVLVVGDAEKLKSRRRIEGAPDLVVEILSDATRRKDTIEKQAKYADAGVREYWIVDPAGRVMTFDWTGEEPDVFPHVYGRNDKVPAAVFDGRCTIDFGDIFKEAGV